MGPLLQNSLLSWTEVLKILCGQAILVKFMETGLFYCRIPYKVTLWESVCVKEWVHKIF